MYKHKLAQNQIDSVLFCSETMKRSRKIAMEKRKTQAQRAVSFSKRRHGLFNKAAELCLLSGSQIGLVVSSPSSKQNLYTFGHPSVEAVFDAFLQGRVPEAVDSGTMGSAVCLYNAVKDLEGELEKRTGKKKTDQFDDDFEQVLERCESLSELEVAVHEMEKLKGSAVKRLNDLLAKNNINGMEDHGDTKSCLNKLGSVVKVEDKPAVVSGEEDRYQDVMGLESCGSKQDALGFGNEWYNITTQAHDTTSSVTTALACVDANPVVEESVPISTMNGWGQLLPYDDDPLFSLW